MNTSKVVDDCIALHKILSKLGTVERADYFPVQGSDRSSIRLENNIEHSYFLAMLCWHTSQHLNLDLSQEKILKLALIHDIPEVYAGDTKLFDSQQAHDSQDDREQKAAERLKHELNFFDDMHDSIQEFTACQSAEAQFVSAMDRLVALIVHINSERTQFVDNGITRSKIEETIPWWRKKIDQYPELGQFTDALLTSWFDVVELAES